MPVGVAVSVGLLLGVTLGVTLGVAVSDGKGWGQRRILPVSRLSAPLCSLYTPPPAGIW